MGAQLLVVVGIVEGGQVQVHGPLQQRGFDPDLVGMQAFLLHRAGFRG